MTAGALRERVALYEPVRADDGAGGYTTTYVKRGTVWAEVRAPRASERYFAEKREQLLDAVLQIRWRADLQPRNGWLAQPALGPILRIETADNTDRRKQFLTLQCREASDASTLVLQSESIQLAAATLAATAAHTASASAAIPLANATLAAAATAGSGEGASASITLAPATLSATASHTASASGAAALADASLAATATHPAVASGSTTLAAATLAAVATHTAQAAGAGTLQGATVAATATHTAQAAGATTLADATLAATAAAPFAITDLGTELLSWFDATRSADLTESAGAVSEWRDRSGRGRRVTQGTAGSQPTLANGGTSTAELQFDGSADIMSEPAISQAFTAANQLPDGLAGGGAGLAFSATGLAFAGVVSGKNRWWVGNGGRDFDGGMTASSATPSIILVEEATDGSLSKITEHALSTGHSAQGVAVDPSDGHVWVARPSLNLIEKINKDTGAQIATITLTGVNGIAMQPDGKLWWSAGTTSTLIEPPSSTALDTVATTGIDGLFYDSARDWLWGANGTGFRPWNVVSKRPVHPTITFSDMNYAEGLWVSPDGSTLKIVHNGTFHRTSTPAASPNRSQLRTYTLDDVDGRYVSAPYADIFFVGRVAAHVSGTNCFLQFGSPLNVASDDQHAMGWYVPSSTTLRQFVCTDADGTTEQVTTSFTTTPTVRGLWHIAIDAVNELATLRLNGVVVAADQSLAAISGGRAFMQALRIGAAIENSVATRFSQARLSAIVQRGGAAALSSTNRQKIEGALAWDHGLVSLLDSGHPYKSARP